MAIGAVVDRPGAQSLLPRAPMFRGAQSVTEVMGAAVDCIGPRDEGVTIVESGETLQEGDNVEPGQVPEEKESDLHWLSEPADRDCLGSLMVKLSHVALIVRDVGLSTWFYSEVMGFDLIRRPNFDRHGAWLTMGNVELHLIKGAPDVEKGGDHPNDLVVPHLAMEVRTPEKLLKTLQGLKKKWDRGGGKGYNLKFESNHTDAKGKVTQFVFEDPDGYWMEICNSDDQDIGLRTTTRMRRLIAQARANTKQFIEPGGIEAYFKKKDVLKYLESPVALQDLSQGILDNLKGRRNTYGDLCQGFSDEGLQDALQRTGGQHAGHAMLYLKKYRQEHGDRLDKPP